MLGFLRQALSISPWLPWSLLCTPDWLEALGVCHYAQLKQLFFQWTLSNLKTKEPWDIHVSSTEHSACVNDDCMEHTPRLSQRLHISESWGTASASITQMGHPACKMTDVQKSMIFCKVERQSAVWKTRHDCICICCFLGKSWLLSRPKSEE